MPDTYTSQFSGEEIDAALRAAQMISGASTPAELRKKLEIRGDTIPVSAEDSTLISEALKKIPTTSGGGVNPNLLDNWYFGRPVNQRGQTEYTGNGYTIDRWSGSVALSLKNGFIRITSSGMYTQIFQTLESDFAGKTFTFSLIVRGTPGAQCRTLAYDYAKDVAYGMGTTHEFVSDGFEMVTVSDTFPSKTPAKLTFILYPDNADTNLSVDILAAKLELGSAQTLAHQENGVWILNEIPDFGEQLRRCRDYCRKIKYATYTGYAMGVAMSANFVRIPIFFEDMRTTPTVDLSSASGLFLTGAEGDVYGVTFTLAWSAPNCIVVDATKTGAFISGQNYFLRNDATSFILASADL